MKTTFIIILSLISFNLFSQTNNPIINGKVTDENLVKINGRCFNDHSFYYEKDSLTNKNNDFIFIKSLLEEYPSMTIKFVQTRNVNESIDICHLRMELFKNKLIELNIDIKRFEFSKEIFILNERISDIRSRIEGIVSSMNYKK